MYMIKNYVGTISSYVCDHKLCRGDHRSPVAKQVSMPASEKVCRGDHRSPTTRINERGEM